MSITNLKRERLEARVTAHDKDLAQRAADIAGCTLSEFIANSVKSAAQQTIRDHHVLELTARSSEAFVEALLNPPMPSERLRAAAREYRQSVEHM